MSVGRGSGLLLLAMAAAGALALRRRGLQRARVGLYFADGLLTTVPATSPAGLELRAAAGEVLRALQTASL